MSVSCVCWILRLHVKFVFCNWLQVGLVVLLDAEGGVLSVRVECNAILECVGQHIHFKLHLQSQSGALYLLEQFLQKILAHPLRVHNVSVLCILTLLHDAHLSVVCAFFSCCILVP